MGWGWPWPVKDPGILCGCCSGTPGANVCFIVSTYVNSTVGSHIYALDNTGATIWTYDTPANEVVYGITRDTSNNVYLGWWGGSGGASCGIIKLDPNGVFQQDFNFSVQGTNKPVGGANSNEYAVLRCLNGFLYFNHYPDANFDIIKKFDLSFTQISSYGKTNFASAYGWTNLSNSSVSPGKLCVVPATGPGTGTGDESVVYWDELIRQGSGNFGHGLNKIAESDGHIIWAHGTAGDFQDMLGSTTSTYLTSMSSGYAFNPNLGVDGYVAIPVTPNYGAFFTGGNDFAANPWSTGGVDFCGTTINTTSYKVGKIPHLIVTANNQLVDNSAHQVPISQKSLADVNWNDGGDRLYAVHGAEIIASICWADSFFFWSYASDGWGANNQPNGSNGYRVKRNPSDIHCGEQASSWQTVASPGIVKGDTNAATLAIRNYKESTAGSGGGTSVDFELPNQNVNNVLCNLTYTPTYNLIASNYAPLATVYCINPLDLSTQWTKAVTGAILSIYGAGNESY